MTTKLTARKFPRLVCFALAVSFSAAHIAAQSPEQKVFGYYLFAWTGDAKR